MPVPRLRGGARAAWLHDPAFDLSFIFGILLLAGAMSGATVLRPTLLLPMLVAHAWLFGYDHLVATYTKLAGRPEDRARNRRLIFQLPPLILVGLYALGRTAGVTGLYALYFGWQLFHTVRQSWGIAQQYRHRAGGLAWDPVRLSEATLWSVPLWGLLHRCAERPEEFLYQPIWLPPLPMALAHAAGVASGALWLGWIVTRVRAFRRGELALGHTLYMLSHALVYLFGYLLIEDIGSGWLLVNVWHNVQYMAFVWLHNRRRFASGPVADARALSWLSQAGYGRAALYYLACLAVAAPAYYLVQRGAAGLDRLLQTAALPALLVLTLTLTVHHYIVDGIIWKRRNNPPPPAAS
ncbi:MAG: hypothetical protein U1A78_25435 [Polyangia bacterium]